MAAFEVGDDDDDDDGGGGDGDGDDADSVGDGRDNLFSVTEDEADDFLFHFQNFSAENSHHEAPSESQPSESSCRFSYTITHPEWDGLQGHADALMFLWVLRHGEGAVFKYMHSLAAGHFTEQGKSLTNLAIFSQQVTTLPSFFLLPPSFCLASLHFSNHNPSGVRQLKQFKAITPHMALTAPKGVVKLARKSRKPTWSEILCGGDFGKCFIP